MKTIPLTQGQEAIVDDDDYELISNMGKWHVNRGYASRVVYHNDGNNDWKTRIFIHHIVMNHQPNMYIVVDHINRNRLDNRKSNLRIVSRSINNSNCKMHRNNQCGFIGVNYHYKRNKKNPYRAIFNGKHLGYFRTPEEASKVYEFAKQQNNVL